MKIGYVCGGKLYEDIKAVAGKAENKDWNRYRRAIYCRLINDSNQRYLSGCRPDTIIITNIGQGQQIDQALKRVGVENHLTADGIVACYHERGSDELASRVLKDFGHEQLPFKRFNSNAAWYYSMLLGHFLMETFKEDVATPVLQIGAYANTICRRLIDIAGKIILHSGKIILKVFVACFESLRLQKLFERCQHAPALT